MAYCPQCLTEYRPDATTCADCGVELLEGSPLYCPKCETYVTPEDTFCDACGELLPTRKTADVPECETHHDRSAVAGCVICGKPLCDECVREVDGKAFCDDDSHMTVYQDYVAVYQTTLVYEADMIRANLEGAGIDVIIFDQHDSVYFVNMGSLARVNVMVQKHQANKALEIIRALLEDGENMDDTTDAEGAAPEQG